MRVGYQESLPNCCGVQDVGGWAHTAHLRPMIQSGTGLFTATFINDEISREAYEGLCKEHKLLYQSPVKANSRSGNRLFLCVFQWKNPRNRLPNL
jgi:hypothetical protein